MIHVYDRYLNVRCMQHVKQLPMIEKVLHSSGLWHRLCPNSDTISLRARWLLLWAMREGTILYLYLALHKVISSLCLFLSSLCVCLSRPKLPPITGTLFVMTGSQPCNLTIMIYMWNNANGQEGHINRYLW